MICNNINKVYKVLQVEYSPCSDVTVFYELPSNLIYICEYLYLKNPMANYLDTNFRVIRLERTVIHFPRPYTIYEYIIIFESMHVGPSTYENYTYTLWCI